MLARASLAVVLGLTCALSETTAGRAQDAAVPTTLTPGQLAIQTLTTGPALHTALALSLGSDHPILRVVAARAVGAMALHDPLLDTALRDALARESNAGVAAEIVRRCSRSRRRTTHKSRGRTSIGRVRWPCA